MSEQSTTSPQKARPLAGSVGRNIGLVIALGVLVVVGWLTSGADFMNLDNMLVILRLASVIGVVAIGMTFVITAGGIDLSVGAIAAIAGAVACTRLVGAADEGAVTTAIMACTWALVVCVLLGLLSRLALHRGLAA